MEFYSKSQPNLIGPKMKKTVFKITSKENSNNTISDKVSSTLYSFYENYIAENKILTIIIISIIVFLIYRYYNKGENNKKEDFSSEEAKIINEIMNNQTSHLRYDTQPSFDRLKSVNDQHEKVTYLPDPVPPVNIPNSGLVYDRNLYGYSQPFENLNNPNYNHDNVYTNPQLNYYNGTYNTYQNAKDTDITNPLGYPTNFNTSTGDFVSGMTNANKQNIVDYQTILDNVNGNLNDSLKIGPKYLDFNSPEFEMEPPYA
jgi:large-conductance mechanosensitive channel